MSFSLSHRSPPREPDVIHAVVACPVGPVDESRLGKVVSSPQYPSQVAQRRIRPFLLLQHAPGDGSWRRRDRHGWLRPRRWRRSCDVWRHDVSSNAQSVGVTDGVGWRQERRSEEEDADCLLAKSGLPTRVNIRHEALPVELRACRSRCVAPPDGDSG